MRVLVTVVSVCSYLLIYLLITVLKPPTEDYLFKLQANTRTPLNSLARSQSFELILSSLGGDLPIDQQGSSESSLNHSSEDNSCDSNQGMEAILHSLNCFPLENPECRQHKTIMRMVKGLAMSFTHQRILSQPQTSEEAANTTKIFQSSDKMNDLFFVYQLAARALKQLPSTHFEGLYLSQGDAVETNTTEQLHRLLALLNSSSLGPAGKEVQRFMKDSTRVRQLEAYFEQSSRQLKRRCANFTKSIAWQLEGLKTVVKVLLGHGEGLQLGGVMSTVYLFDKLSLSVGEFYSRRPAVESLDHMEGEFDAIQFYYFLFGAVIVMVLIFSQINIKGKVQKQFRHAFPQSRRFKVE